MKIPLEIGIFAAQQFEFIENCLLLGHGKSSHAKAEIWMLPRMIEDGSADGNRFHPVRASLPPVVSAAFDKLK